MPALKNPRYERLAQEIVKKPVDRSAAAVRAGFAKGSAKVTVSKLWHDDKTGLRARVEELQAEAAKGAVVTAQDIALELDQARSIAINDRMPSAAVSASMGKAKVLGLIVDKTLQMTARLEDMTEPQLRTLLGLGPNDPLPLK